MGYRIRVLSTSDQIVPVARLNNALTRDKFEAVIKCDPGAELTWEQIELAHSNGPAIALIERNVVLPGSLAESELAEFLEEMEDERPASAVTWLKSFFPRVRTIYALQVLNGTYVGNGWDILGCVKGAIWNFADGIIQADAEGFSNEDGYHILWQFSDSVKGYWAMGVLKDGKWIHFRMDLGNRRHREAFLNGHVPRGIPPID